MQVLLTPSDSEGFWRFASRFVQNLHSPKRADLMAADAAEIFTESPGRMYDRDTAQAWSTVILASGHSRPAV